MIYGKNRVNDELDNIDCDKVVDAKIYAKKYINIVNDNLCLSNRLSDSIEELIEGLNVDTFNDIMKNKLKDFKSSIIKCVTKFDKYVKQDTKKKDTKTIIQYDANNNNNNNINNNNNNNNNKEPDIKRATCDDIKAYIIDKQELIKKRYKSLIETNKTIKNNDDLVYNTLKKLPNESQPKLIELIRLDTLLNDSINVIWREIYERNKKNIKKIDTNKIKNVDTFIHKLINVINNKKQLIRTFVIVISDNQILRYQIIRLIHMQL